MGKARGLAPRTVRFAGCFLSPRFVQANSGVTGPGVRAPVASVIVGTEKRQRQDQRRQEKVKEIEAVVVKKAKAKTRNRILMYAIPGLVVLAAVLFWPRGNDDDRVLTATDSGVPDSVAVVTTVPALPSAIAKKPEISIPAGDPPKTLQVKDLVVGTGATAVKGSTLRVNYVGKSWSTKEEFDSSWQRGSTYTVQDLGSGGVIAGWGEGLIGIKQGGRRQLTIPADKAYGSDGSGEKIKPGETLVFVIDAVEVLPPTAG